MPKREALYTLYPKQQEAMHLLGLTPDWEQHTDAVEELLYGGEAGGGKSYLMRCAGVTLCTIWPGAVVPIFRRTYPELEETHIRAIQREVPQTIATYNSERHELRFKNGSVLEFRYCEREEHVYRYQSAEWDALLLDEATHFTGPQVEYLRSRVRSTRPGWRRVFLYTTNPGNAGHLFFKTGWVDAAPPGQVFTAGKSEGGMRRCFFRARLSDNPALGDEYRQQLEGISDPALREALLEGNWDIFAGQFFSEWRRDKHTVPRFDIPDEWRIRYVAVDWGYGAPWSCHFYVRDEDLWRGERVPRWYAYREFYGPGLLDDDQAGMIREAVAVDQRLAGKTPLRFTYLADPSMWNRKPQSAITTASVYAANGVPLQPANNDRVNGWKRAHDYLKVQPDGLPSLIFFEDCLEAVRTIPAVSRDKLNPEDVDTKVEDHAADEMRYFVMGAGPIERRQEQPRTRSYGYAGQPPKVSDLSRFRGPGGGVNPFKER